MADIAFAPNKKATEKTKENGDLRHEKRTLPLLLLFLGNVAPPSTDDNRIRGRVLMIRIFNGKMAVMKHLLYVGLANTTAR